MVSRLSDVNAPVSGEGFATAGEPNRNLEHGVLHTD